ncbi:MAG: hypothetical protein ACLFWB_06470, partial [Armatimonadota bacterium]
MTDLQDTVGNARELLATNRIPNERAVDISVVQPILRALGWDPTRIEEMYPEYSVGGGRVDWALCQDEAPCLFLEEKAPDQGLGAHEEQLLQYSFAQGIPLAVLTNGNEWWLYLPLEEGNWAARKFAVIDLQNQPPEHVCHLLDTYLAKDAVWSGDAKDTAKKKFAEAQEQKRIREQLPGIINDLLISPSEFIIEVFQTEAQAELGALPGQDLVKNVLQQIASPGVPTSIGNEPNAENLKPASDNLPPTHTKPTQMALAGQSFNVKSWKDVLIQTAKWLQSSGRPLPVEKRRGHKWVLVSKSANKLTAPREIGGGLHVSTNYSAKDCVRHALWLLQEAGMPEDV